MHDAADHFHRVCSDSRSADANRLLGVDARRSGLKGDGLAAQSIVEHSNRLWAGARCSALLRGQTAVDRQVGTKRCYASRCSQARRMNWMNTKTTAATVVTMMGSLAVAYALDKAFQVVRQTASQTFNPVPGLAVAAGGSVLLAGLLVALAWLFLAYKVKKWVSLTALVIGLLLLSAPALRMLVVCPLPFTPSPNSLLWHASAFVAVIGGVALVRK